VLTLQLTFFFVIPAEAGIQLRLSTYNHYSSCAGKTRASAIRKTDGRVKHGHDEGKKSPQAGFRLLPE
jgi:hypothetical protein